MSWWSGVLRAPVQVLCDSMGRARWNLWNGFRVGVDHCVTSGGSLQVPQNMSVGELHCTEIPRGYFKRPLLYFYYPIPYPYPNFPSIS